MASEPKPRAAKNRACLPRSLAFAAGGAKFFAPDFAGAIDLRGFERLHGRGHRLGLQAFALQLMAYARGTKATGAAVDDRLNDAGLADEVFGLQVVKHLGQLPGLFFMRCKLALEFST